MNYEIVESFAQMAREKRMDKDVLVGIVEDLFSMMMKKKYGMEARFDVVVNMDKGDIEIFLLKTIVDEVTDPVTQISFEEVKKKSKELLDIGDEFVEIIDMAQFGRRLITNAKQGLNQRIKEIEKEVIFKEYQGTLNEIIIGEIYQVRKNEILVNHNRNELILPKNEQIPKERYRKGETIRAIVKEVRKNAGHPQVIISRADPAFLGKLFELEIPEIYDGIIEIKAISREPGERAKVAVESHDDRIDPVGACVGMKGVRIHAIVRELNNENIDVITWTEDSATLIQRALSPAKLKSIEIDEDAKKAVIVVDKTQASLAIGRNGQNVRLASKITGFEIKVEQEGAEEEYDIDLIQFREELSDQMYERLIDEGFETARDVIEANDEDLLLVEGLDIQKVRAMKEMMKQELAEAELDEDDEEKVKPAARRKDEFDDESDDDVDSLPPTEIPPVS